MLKSSLKTLSIVLFGSIACTSIAQAECSIYEHENYEGKSGVIQDNDYVKFYGENEDDGVMPRDVPNARVFRDPSWRNILSSFRSSDNCDVVMYTTPSANKHHVRYKGNTPTLGENNDKSASVLCQCK